MATPEERSEVVRAAEKAGTDLSPFVREVLLAALTGERLKRDRRAWLAAERLRRAALLADGMLAGVEGAVARDALRSARDLLAEAIAELK